MITGDASYIKKINRSLIIKEIVNKGMISRADLAKEVDLTRATISVQVADLLDEGLVIETHLEHNAVGRKPIMLSLNADAGYALGIDLDNKQITYTLTNLLGAIIAHEEIALHTTNYDEIVVLLAENINRYANQYDDARYGIVGVCIAVHGLVSNEEIVHFVPQFGWNDVGLKHDLEKLINLSIHIENNANLSAFAERIFTHHDTENLLSATFYSGIGLGMIMNNKFVRGHDGFAGEIGHMIIVPQGNECACGNHGCFERYASDLIILDRLAKVKEISNVTYGQVAEWIADDDDQVMEILQQFILYVSIGLNNMINIYNPEVIVIDSELLQLYPNATKAIQDNLHSKISHCNELSISLIGRKSCVLGACALAIQQFLDVPVLNLPYETITK
ncbi:MAG: ROK family transcriptional regulator [Candidatus Pristimantibacillus lignocellulolyticus]|uniref:ROK family transcriptional regulator n=1 Tax=Candidatus Pristimantibacillus lignocellulolyticus TaxID=2994561 RepID=A0A9J6ZCK5_9BACL|nr:MAG: ROK family transcriptional regulator [Candidatus Pristimantibacillus lignocellulolyticus]